MYGSFLAVDCWLYVKTNNWEWESDRSIALCASDHTLSSPSCLPPSQLYSVRSHGSIYMLTACVCAFHPDVNTWLILCLRQVNLSWWGFMWISLDKKSRFFFPLGSILRYFWYVCLHYVRQTLHLYSQASECSFFFDFKHFSSGAGSWLAQTNINVCDWLIFLSVADFLMCATDKKSPYKRLISMHMVVIYVMWFWKVEAKICMSQESVLLIPVETIELLINNTYVCYTVILCMKLLLKCCEDTKTGSTDWMWALMLFSGCVFVFLQREVIAERLGSLGNCCTGAGFSEGSVSSDSAN